MSVVECEVYAPSHPRVRGGRGAANPEANGSILAAAAGQQRDAWLVRYVSDGAEEHFEEEELRSGSDGPAPTAGNGKPVLVVRDMPERKRICNALTPIFDYIEVRLLCPPPLHPHPHPHPHLHTILLWQARLTGTTVGESECQAQYSCVAQYELCRVVRAFNPNFAAAFVDPAFVDAMAAIKPLQNLNMLTGMKRELPLYLSAAQNAQPFDTSDVDAFTESVLKWWRINGKSFPTWALAARISFAISPSSASCDGASASSRSSRRCSASSRCPPSRTS